MIIPPENNSNTPLSVTFSSWSFDYLKMNFLGLLTPSRYCLPLISTPQLNCLKQLPCLHPLALHTFPILGLHVHTHQHCTNPSRDTTAHVSARTLSAMPCALSSPLWLLQDCTSLSFLVFWGCPQSPPRALSPHFDLLMSEGDADAFSLPDTLSSIFFQGNSSPFAQNVSDRDHESWYLRDGVWCKEGPITGFPWNVLNWNWGLMFLSSLKVLKYDSRTARGYGSSVPKIADRRE